MSSIFARSIAKLSTIMLCFAVSNLSHGAESEMHNHHHHHGMKMDLDGMVMHENKNELPKDCASISEEREIEVRASTSFARNGLTYGFSQHEWKIKPCARVTVTFHNDDEVRHQWMVHGLPKYLYPQGMFHLEVNGQRKVTGTFILPSDHKTYLVHCDLSHHMEQGLKAQLVVGRGDGDLPSIPGITNMRYPDRYR